ncbi:MAG TPA: protein kinase, partial [Polyangiales bacterium]|nr:protein kinase [Polyangiales bacterium]
MATIEYAHLIGPRGFQRPVAIKRLHPQLARDPEFVTMFVDEARMSSRLHHANLVPTLDVIEGPGELALVMEYVHGVALSTLFELARSRGEQIPVRVAVTLLSGVLHGLHAAHETPDEQGVPMQLVHRDVSPQNVLVGADGVPRVLDFGVAKALGRLRSTPSGEVKGKLAYIAPEQLRGAAVDRRADVYGASAVLWEALTGRPLFDGPNESALMHAVLHESVPAPSSENPEVSAVLDALVLQGLTRSVDERFASARELAVALERTVGVCTQSEVADWLEQLAGAQLAARASTVQQLQDAAERGGGWGATRPLPAQGTRKLDESEPRADRTSSHVEKRLLPRHKLRALALGLLASALLALWAWAQLREPAPAPVTATRSPLPGHQSALEPAPEPVPVSGSEPVPNPVPLPAAVVDPQSSAVPETPPTATAAPLADQPAAARPRAHTAKTGAGSRAASRARACVPPYVIDRMGIRHPKPECL